MDQTVNSAALAAPSANLSLWGLFLEADIVVKLVMLILLLASVWVWAIIIEKMVSLRRVNREAVASSRMLSGPAAAWTSCMSARAPTRPTRSPPCSARR